jgi:hypothetical protein
VENYFQYFSEIEERYQRRRGTLLLLSTLDWALIETWKEAGIPLEAVLRGIDEAFDNYDSRPRKTRKINSLAYCTQAVMAAAEDMKEAAIGSSSPRPAEAAVSKEQISHYLENRAAALEAISHANGVPAELRQQLPNISASLREMAASIGTTWREMEDAERRLTVLEEKIFAALISSRSESEMLALRAEAERALAPYRSKMQGPQIEQLQKQFVHRRLLEQHKLPRLSLFYMQ